MRVRKPWYREFNDTWYVKIDGKQVPLAKRQAIQEGGIAPLLRVDGWGRASAAGTNGSGRGRAGASTRCSFR
jgi:hypothetical protein